MQVDRILSTILTRADSGARLVVIFGAATMVAVVSAQVVMRYVFNGSFDWADEVSRVAFVWTTFLAIPLGIREGSHVGITLLVDKLPAPWRSAIARLMNLLAALMMFVVFWTSISVASATWSERLGAVNMTSSIFFVPIIFSAAHSGLHLLYLALFPVPSRPTEAVS